MDQPAPAPPATRSSVRRVGLHLTQAGRYLRAGARAAWLGWLTKRRRRACARLFGDLGREAWRTIPSFPVTPFTDTLAEFDVRIQAISAEIEKFERQITELTERRKETIAASDAKITAKEEEIRAATDRHSGLESSRATLAAERAGQEAELFRLELEVGRLKTVAASCDPQPGGSAAPAPNAAPAAAENLAETEAKAAALRRRMEESGGRIAAAESEAAPLQDALRRLQRDKETLVAEREATLREIDNRVSAYRDQVGIRRDDCADLESKKAPVYVQLGQRLFESRGRADLFSARYDEIARVAEGIALLGQQAAALQAEMAALPRGPRLTATAAVALPCLVLVLLFYTRVWGGRLTTPEKAFAAVQDAAARSDWGRLFDLLAGPHQKEVEKKLAQLKEKITATPEAERAAVAGFSGLDPARWSETTAREFFSGAAGRVPGAPGAPPAEVPRPVLDLRGAAITGVETTPEGAFVRYQRAGKAEGGAEAEQRLHFVREGWEWRLDPR